MEHSHSPNGHASRRKLVHSGTTRLVQTKSWLTSVFGKCDPELFRITLAEYQSATRNGGLQLNKHNKVVIVQVPPDLYRDATGMLSWRTVMRASRAPHEIILLLRNGP